MRPTHGIPILRWSVFSSRLRPPGGRGLAARARASRRRAIGGVSVALLLGAMCSAPPAIEAADDAGGPGFDALSGPWRWIEPELGGFHSLDKLAIGPWIEIAITRDPERRRHEIDQLETELVARDGRLPGSWNARSSARAPILRQAALDSARLLEAAGEAGGAAEGAKVGF